jgi:steroid delta-isomerase-like uncharacterized protein
MTTEENKAIIRRFMEAVDRHDLGMVEEMLAPNCTWTYLFDAPAIEGRDAIRAWMQGILEALPDFHTTVDSLIAERDEVVVRFTNTGTQQGEFRGTIGTLPPSGRPLNQQGVLIFRIADGRIPEVWQSHDRLSMMQQLGAPPAPAQTAR